MSEVVKILFNLKQKFAGLLSERAFTLIEALFALSIFMCIVFFMTPMLQVLLRETDPKAAAQSLEWEVFCSQVKKEIRMSSRAQINSGRLYLTRDADTILYEMYGSNIRRRVNSTGNEIILQNVAAFSITIVNNAVKIDVVDIWGQEYSFSAYCLIKWA